MLPVAGLEDLLPAISNSVPFVMSMATASAPLGSSRRAISPREGVKMTPPQQISAATPQPEELDACPSKAIHTTINQNLNAAVPVRTRTPSRSSLTTLTRSTNPADIARQQVLIVFSPSVHQAYLPSTHVQTNDMSQGVAADQDWLGSAQQARRLGPPWSIRYGPFSLHHYL